MRYFIAIFIFLIVALISILGFRGSKSEKPPLEIFPDMDRQAKFHPQAASSLFSDSRADRPVVPGTVPFNLEEEETYPFLQPKDSFNENEYYATGKQGEAFGRGFPVQLTHELMERGRERFDIYCAVCHGETGDGNGITKSYGMVATPSYHSEKFRKMPEGEIFNTITHGKNNMGPYAAKLSVEDRWAVVAYLRALQRARHASVEDVPPEKRGELGL